MHIHKFERIWIGVSVLLIIGYIVTIIYGSIGAGVAMVGNEGGTVDTPRNPTESPRFKEPGLYKVDDKEFELYLMARKFSFSPGGPGQTIKIPAGSKVTFHVTSSDVLHGVELVHTNVNTMAIPGQIGKFTVKFDKPAEYGLLCNEYCGVGHHIMEGQLKVVSGQDWGPKGAEQ